MNSLSTELSSYIIEFKNHGKKISVGKEDGEYIAQQKTKRQPIMMRDPVSDMVYTGNWNEVEVIPVQRPMEDRPVYCWGDFVVGFGEHDGQKRRIVEIRKMHVHDLSVAEKWTGYYIDETKAYPENFPHNFVVLK